jgi:hypothetical protein
MKIEFTVPFRRVPTPLTPLAGPAQEENGNPPRIAWILALAHKLDALVRSGAVGGYVELARLGHVAPARVTQIMVLLHLAPVIQEYILFLSAADARLVYEVQLRKIAREPRWDRQLELFERLLKK